MINSVVVQGTTRATDAVLWAQEHLGEAFSVTVSFPSEAYQFIFSDAQQALMFAIKWL